MGVALVSALVPSIGSAVPSYQIDAIYCHDGPYTAGGAARCWSYYNPDGTVNGGAVDIGSNAFFTLKAKSPGVCVTTPQQPLAWYGVLEASSPDAAGDYVPISPALLDSVSCGNQLVEFRDVPISAVFGALGGVRNGAPTSGFSIRVHWVGRDRADPLTTRQERFSNTIVAVADNPL